MRRWRRLHVPCLICRQHHFKRGNAIPGTKICASRGRFRPLTPGQPVGPARIPGGSGIYQQSQADYLARGMGPFTYEMRGKAVTVSYHEVPPDMLEQPQELTVWAQRAIRIAATKPSKRLKSK